MELWDLYDENRRPLEEVVIRGTKIPKGKYHIVVECMIIDQDDNILITKRAPGKHHPYTWECTTGSIMSGEDSLSGIRRELFEETGLELTAEQLHLIRTENTDRTIRDTYLACIPHIDLSLVHLQAEETIEAKTCTLEQFQKSEFDEKDPNAEFRVAQYSRFQSLMGKIMRLRDQLFGKEEPIAPVAPVSTARTTMGSKQNTLGNKQEAVIKSSNPFKKAVPITIQGQGLIGRGEEDDALL